jgi:hypothetical protein
MNALTPEEHEILRLWGIIRLQEIELTALRHANARLLDWVKTTYLKATVALEVLGIAEPKN